VRNLQISESVPVHISSYGEIEGHPRSDFIWFRNHLVAIFWVDFNDFAPFSMVCNCFVVKNSVENQADIVVFCRVPYADKGFFAPLFAVP